jgi:diguanylate cyclase (GGDEF)-like protein/PAS domain S-box-containing protein
MGNFINIFITMLLLSSLLTFIAAVIAWRRSVPGLTSLTLLLLAMGLWSVSYALQWLPVPSAVQNLLPKITYIGVVTVPGLFLIFALAFAQYDRFLTKRLFLGLLIEPVLTLILVWTNKFHHLVFSSMIYRVSHGFNQPEFIHGSWYYLNLIYSYLVIAIGITALVSGYLRCHPSVKKQYSMILAAAIVPWTGNVIGEFFMTENSFDITPLIFGLSALFFAYAVLRDRFIDIISAAHGHLIDSMSDGVLVLDTQNQIVEFNPAMQQLLNYNPVSLVGQSASAVLEAWLGRPQSMLNEEKSQTEFRVPGSPSRYLDVRLTLLLDKHQRVKGRLLVFRDITERKQVEKKLRNANERLQGQLIEIGTLQSELRAQAIRDPLTNLFNRRYLDETLERELARAAREHYPVCVIMMDLDHFKVVNDTYGHEAGDQVLKALARTLSAGNRRGDFACRFGGEEFVVVMPNIAVEVAYQRAEELRTALNSLQIQYGKFSLSTTISIGIACYPSHGEGRESVLRAADRAMYAAKNAGRNHILTYDTLEAGRRTMIN